MIEILLLSSILLLQLFLILVIRTSLKMFYSLLELMSQVPQLADFSDTDTIEEIVEKITYFEDTCL